MTPAGPAIAWRVIRRDTVASTMSEAAALASEGAPEGTVVVARSQTAGRGRAGRTWIDPGAALLATVLLRPPLPAAAMTAAPLWMGVAAAEAIEAACPGLRVWIKWPNDLWLGERNAGRKTGGILVEIKAGGAMLAGFGVNLAFPGEERPDGAADLRSFGGETSADELLGFLLDRIARRYTALVAAGGRLPLDEWLARAALLGERVAVVDGGSAAAGRFAGVREDGALLLAEDSGEVRVVVAGDLARGPRPAP